MTTAIKPEAIFETHASLYGSIDGRRAEIGETYKALRKTETGFEVVRQWCKFGESGATGTRKWQFSENQSDQAVAEYNRTDRKIEADA